MNQQRPGRPAGAVSTASALRAAREPPDDHGRPTAIQARNAFHHGRHRWLGLVARDPTLPGAAIRVAVLIWDWMHAERGYAWPPLARIASELGIHRATAIRSVEALSERGWISIERSTGTHRSNRYRICFGRMDDDGDAKPMVATAQQ
jgi:hypothetical protein